MADRKRWYLDTSAVRKLGSRLGSLPSPHHFRSSAFTLIELLNGIDKSETEYRRRAASIRNLIQSKVYIIWGLPGAVRAAAFSVPIAEEERIQQLRRIIEVVVAEISLDTFQTAISSQGLSEALQFFHTYDDLTGNLFIQTRREILRLEFERSVRSIDPNASYQDFCDHWMTKNFDTLCAITLKALSLTYKRGKPSPADLMSGIPACYDRSIDIFIRAYSWAAMNWEKNGNPPKRNDVSDLCHFLYVKRSHVLVSEDKGMLAIADGIGVPTENSDSVFMNARRPP